MTIQEQIASLQGTIGAERVRLNFNPKEDTTVSRIKIRAAEQINDIESLRLLSQQHPTKAGEINRACSIAQTDCETSAMYAVKAATAIY